MKSGLSIAVLLTVLLAGNGAAPALADAPRTVPIEMSDTGHILVNARVNGSGPYPFIVDTAAGATVLFDPVSSAAGLEDVTMDRPVIIQGVNGTSEARLVDVGTLQLGAWQVPLSRAVSIPAPSHLDDVAGVLGADILYRQPVGFSLGEGRLDIYEQGAGIDESAMPDGEWFAVPIDERGGEGVFFWTTLLVDGVAVDAVIDTGARRSAINIAGARALGSDPANATLAADEPVRGATAHETPAWVLPVTTVQLGEHVWGSRQFTLADLAIFEAMGRVGIPTIILGADFLAEQDFIIDPGENVLWVQKRRSAALGFISSPAVEFSGAGQ